MGQNAKNKLDKIIHNDNTGIAIILIVLCVITTIINPNFMSKMNVVNMLRKLSQVSFISLCMTLLIISGGIDLSVGSVVGLGGIVAGALMTNGVPVIVAVLIAIGIGVAFGLLNGLLVTKINIPPFIVTLGTMYIAQGLVNVITQGKPVYPLPASFITIFADVTLFGIPITIYAMLMFLAGMYFILNNTIYGRSVYAVGGNEKTASTAGIDVVKTRILAYVAMGAASAFTGLLIAARMKSAHPASGGGWEMKAIAATVIGGTSISGGSGSVIGTMFGAAIMAVLEIAMTMMKISVYYQNIVVGIIIIAAVIFDIMKRKRHS